MQQVHTNSEYRNMQPHATTWILSEMAMLSDVSFTKQSHRCLVLIAEPDMETAVSPRKLREFSLFDPL